MVSITATKYRLKSQRSKVALLTRSSFGISTEESAGSRLGRHSRAIRDGTADQRLFFKGVFSLFAETPTIRVGCQEGTDKPKTEGPQKGSSQLESVTVDADLPKLS